MHRLRHVLDRHVGDEQLLQHRSRAADPGPDARRDRVAVQPDANPHHVVQALFPANACPPETDRCLSRILGHRDVLATVCPGNDIEGRIQALITAVNTAIGNTPTCNAAPWPTPGRTSSARVGSTVALATSTTRIAIC